MFNNLNKSKQKALASRLLADDMAAYPTARNFPVILASPLDATESEPGAQDARYPALAAPATLPARQSAARDVEAPV